MGLFDMVYDPLMIPADRLGLRRWRAWATALEGGRILEVGVGTGLNLRHYRGDGEIFAIDPSPDMLRHAVVRARRIGTRVRFCLARAEALPFGPAAFDAAVATLVFCTVNNLPMALAEVRRVLKPLSPVRLIEHVRLNDGAGARLQDLLTPAWRRIAGGCRLNRNTVAAVQAAGFEIRHIEEKLGGVFIGIDALARDTRL